jgi:hypothetical protein
MTFARSEEQRLFGETLRRFLDSENDFETRRQRLSLEHPGRMALWPGLAELGAIGAAFDEAHGGYAGDARTLAVAMAELGRSLAVEPFTEIAGAHRLPKLFLPYDTDRSYPQIGPKS